MLTIYYVICICIHLSFYSFSRQPFINEMRESAELPDKTPSYKDFTHSKLNRFLNPSLAMKNRVCNPMKHLYFYHSPPNISADELINHFVDAGAPKPVSTKIFESKTGILFDICSNFSDFRKSLFFRFKKFSWYFGIWKRRRRYWCFGFVQPYGYWPWKYVHISFHSVLDYLSSL